MAQRSPSADNGPRTEQRPDGTLYYVTGSMGSGKTSWVRERNRAARRMLAWDGKGVDWGPAQRCQVLGSLEELRSRALSSAPARLSVRVPVTRANFEAFCRMAWVWLRIAPGVLVVDEIADVTSTAKAPAAWGEIARKSRAFGAEVYVTTQRPQECDKTAQGNAMVYHCGRMSDEDDQRYVARRLLGSMRYLPQVAALGPLEYLERDVRTGRVSSGKTRPR